MDKSFLRLAMAVLAVLASAPSAFAGISDRLPANYRESRVSKFFLYASQDINGNAVGKLDAYGLIACGYREYNGAVILNSPLDTIRDQTTVVRIQGKGLKQGVYSITQEGRAQKGFLWSPGVSIARFNKSGGAYENASGEMSRADTNSVASDFDAEWVTGDVLVGRKKYGRDGQPTQDASIYSTGAGFGYGVVISPGNLINMDNALGRTTIYFSTGSTGSPLNTPRAVCPEI
jgi:hypothetical protein